jgi:radical SAM protein with 4Fe4S-binding SPASM domain
MSSKEGEIKKFTGACFPGGEKTFVDADGRFHICEKISPNYPIGNIEKGFDIKRIKSLLQEFNEEVIKKECWKCKFWFLCGICFVHAGKKGKLKIECDDIKTDYVNLIKRFLNKSEAEDEKVNNVSPGSITDYIDQL